VKAAVPQVTHRPRISEIFLSLQGEGPSAGTPAHFIRLQGCDVVCHWCDTKYSWDFSAGHELDWDELWQQASALGDSGLLVVTGGEPLERPEIVELLVQGLERWPRVEVETSGVMPAPLHHERLFYNVSPKLPSATSRWAETWRHVGTWIADPHATFKIVVGEPPDLDDARRLIAEQAIPKSRVMLMHEGITDDIVRARATALAHACKRDGFRMSPRLHIWMWGPRRGV